MMEKKIFYAKHEIDKEDVSFVVRALQDEKITQGFWVEAFENRLRRISGAKYAAAVSSGTSALHAAMFAAGIKVGDEVITTPLSFVATANCVIYQGGVPVFADVDYETGLLDPKEVERKITQKTKAVVTVDYAGHPSFFDQLRKLCKKHSLFLIDDACHSLGAKYKEEYIGTQADMSVFSFHPAKAITSGEGGAIVTNNQDFYEKVRLFRNHGIVKNQAMFVDKKIKNEPWFYEVQELGYNYRITDFQCALGFSQMKRLKKFIKKRTKLARYYTRALANDERLRVPVQLAECKSAWHLYPLRISDKFIKKVELFKEFKRRNIFPQVHFVPIHTHPFYRKSFGYKWGDFPSAEQFYNEEISLPLYPGIRRAELDLVIKVLRNI